MKIVACFDLAPRKLGSLEQWILEFAEAARARGHSLRCFGHDPVHPAIAERFAALETTWEALDQVKSAPFRWGRTFRRWADCVYLNLIPPRSPVALAAALAWPRPVLFFDGISGSAPGDPAPSWLSALLDPWTFRRVAAVAGCSDYVARRDRERFAITPERCTTIYNGVDCARFAAEPRIEAGTPVLLTVANLIPQKGIGVLLDACALLADLPWRLVIVGDGPESQGLKDQASRGPVADRIEFAGLRDDVDQFLRSADLFIHPAVWQEAFGLTIAEAMASGCAVVASRTGGIPELVSDGVTGRLFPAGDPAALAAVLRELLNDPASRRALGVRAREEAARRFSMEESVAKQLHWIEQWGA